MNTNSFFPKGKQLNKCFTKSGSACSKYTVKINKLGLKMPEKKAIIF